MQFYPHTLINVLNPLFIGVLSMRVTMRATMRVSRYPHGISYKVNGNVKKMR